MIERLTAIPPIRKISSAWFHYRTNAWRFSESFREGPDVAIDRPIYLLGTQNGGLTLLARILHRLPEAISVSGDHRYWAGEDEAQDALRDILPEDFGWRRVDLPGFASQNHGWLYATEKFIQHYRRASGSVVPEASQRYRRIVKGIIRQQGGNRAVRFIDKSQTLTVRVGAMAEALSGADPCFVLLTRNPFAVVWGQANRHGTVSKLAIPVEDKVRLCAQHWANSFAAALEDAKADPAIKLRHWRFEDLLAEPEKVVAEICEFADLTWAPNILPSANDKIPWGSRTDAYNRRKWYPLRSNVNDRSLSELPDWAVNEIAAICEPLSTSFGYERP